MANENRKLIKISKFHENTGSEIPDLRDRMLLDEHERVVGRVVDMIFDPGNKLVRYLQVHIDPEMADTDTYRNLLIPAGFVRADLQNGEVYLYGLEMKRLLFLPDYDEGEVTPEFESEMISRLVPEAGKVARNPDEFYNVEHFSTRFIR